MASIRQRSGTWQARVTRNGYPTEVKSFKTRTDALRWARQVEAAMDGSAYRTRSEIDKAPLSEVLQRYADTVSPTKRGHQDEVIRIQALRRRKLAGFSLNNLTPAVIAAFRDERLRTVKAGAVIRDLSLLSSVINHARREWGASIDNPCLLVKKPACPPGRTRVLAAEEEARLLAALEPTGRRNPEMRPLVQLALNTAMRRGELLALQWQNVDRTAQIAHLPMSKNGQPRSVPLSNAALAALATLPDAQRGRVFSMSAEALAAAFKRATARAGLSDLRFHDLRHTATSRMAEKLPNLVELAAVTGHQSLQMLKRYYHPDATALAHKLSR